MRITYICLYNNKFQLESLLLPSMKLLSESERNYSLILVDSKKEGYISAAQAFNCTIQRQWDCLGEIVCFIHQDIRFDTTEFHDRLIKEFSLNPFQIIGTAGIKENKSTLSNLRYWDDKSYICNDHIETKECVESLDESCFATSKKVLREIRFDEYCCNHWHLYAVDFCYQAVFKRGWKSYVIPETIYHKFNDREGLYVDKYFLKTFYKLIKKYRNNTKYITAPCYRHISTGILGELRILVTYVHHLYFLR